MGSGSGYLCMVFAQFFPNAKMTGIEHISQIVDFSIAYIQKNFEIFIDKKL